MSRALSTWQRPPRATRRPQVQLGTSRSFPLASLPPWPSGRNGRNGYPLVLRSSLCPAITDACKKWGISSAALSINAADVRQLPSFTHPNPISHVESLAFIRG